MEKRLIRKINYRQRRRRFAYDSAPKNGDKHKFDPKRMRRRTKELEQGF